MSRPYMPVTYTTTSNGSNGTMHFTWFVKVPTRRKRLPICPRCRTRHEPCRPKKPTDG